MWVKICGIRDVPTARAVAELRPDAIGLNFYRGSVRAVDRQVAAEITAVLPAPIEPVGVFVNHSVDEIVALCDQCGLRTIQLHGDEPASLLPRLAAYRIIRAFRVGAEGLESVADYLDECGRLQALPWACLVDARVEGSYGGTGKTAPWDLLTRDYRFDVWPPLILAGGLTPENVVAAVAAVRPFGVDVAGGVESSPGVKDIAAVARFIAAARATD
jgi:phosphoribosylanthranilate isomerase